MMNMDKRQDRQMSSGRSGGERQLESAEIVIIGNGIAGLTAAIEARRIAPNKRIVIITEQNHPTINTPALKQFAVAKLAREQLLAFPTGTERTERIHLVNARVEEIHAQSKYLTLSGKRHFGYESLLLATGSSPAGLPANIPGRDFDGVMTLHRLQDYLNLRRRIPEVREAVVVGGGVLANETVMGLLHWGIRVHWLIRGKAFMKNMLDETASEIVLEHTRKAGALIHMETEITGVVGRIGAVAGVITNQQEMIPCELVLSCTGTGPVLGLAKTCSVPILHKNGILVDDKLRTSVRDIYAAGDVAALLNPLTGRYETRAQWFSAVEMGRTAGAQMAGDKEATGTFGVQWHATHLAHRSMLLVGEPQTKDKNVAMLTDTSNGYRRLAIANDRLIGYLSMSNTPPDSLAIKQLIDEGFSVRNIVKDLLKGTLNAREYVTNLRSRAANAILSGRAPTPSLIPMPPEPAPRQEQPSEHPERRQRDTGPFVLPETARQTGPLRREAPTPERREVETPVPAQLQQSARSGAGSQPRVFFEEELGAFNGNLPAVSPARSAAPARRREEPYYEEDTSPFTGNLPALDSAINASTSRISEPERATRNLWGYTEERRDRI
jgi:NADPH-dependent 2,4-dienoyl-CoA reductase/sulfur reductase-like enzyme